MMLLTVEEGFVEPETPTELHEEPFKNRLKRITLWIFTPFTNARNTKSKP